MNIKLIKILALIWGISGAVILFAVVAPIIFYKSRGTNTVKTLGLISPIVNSVTPVPNIKGADSDLTHASNWFVGGAKNEDFYSEKISYYTLSIPKLHIQNASVAIGGDDLSKSLIQYPGTAVPGKRGNTVIFGHSILPIFYNPENYISIFSKLPTLRVGDEINVEYDGISFKYRVESLFEVLPTDIQVLEQDVSDSFLSLITCVPPGDPGKPRRLIVRARVIPPEETHAYLRH